MGRIKRGLKRASTAVSRVAQVAAPLATSQIMPMAQGFLGASMNAYSPQEIQAINYANDALPGTSTIKEYRPTRENRNEKKKGIIETILDLF